MKIMKENTAPNENRQKKTCVNKYKAKLKRFADSIHDYDE